MSVVHASRGRNEPASPHLRSEVAIVCDLAARTVGSDVVDWAGLAADYDRIRDLIEQVVPGFERVNERVRHARVASRCPTGRGTIATFPTATGRARLTVNHFEPIEVPAGPPAPADDPVARPVQHDDLRPRRPLPRHPPRPPGAVRRRRRPRGARASPTARSSTSSASGPTAVERRAPAFRLVAYPTPPGTCAAYFPEANVLVPLGSTADGSGTPDLEGDRGPPRAT